ncbi:hypothetical protein GCM10027589_01400 [Actinocorallia lasiicapitis]
MSEGTWQVGDVIDGRYRVTKVHEHGGMGLVYRVRHLDWGTDLAVKSPRPELYRTADDRARFVTEAENWVALGLYPHVCVCHYVRTLEGVPRVFAEYVSGGSLRDWLDDGRLYDGDDRAVLGRILDIAIQAAWGLAHAHRRGLVHQDVKPANLLMDADGTAKVTDFGLAGAIVGTVPQASGGGATVLVPTGGMTPAYASPEQAAGGPIGRRTDVYSLAVSMLEMLTGGVVWMAGVAAGETLAALRADGGFTVEPPPGLADLLARCLSTDPAGRPASMDEVAQELARVHEQALGVPHPRLRPAPVGPQADEINNLALTLIDLGRHDEADVIFATALRADPRHLLATYNAGLIRWRRALGTDEDALTSLEAVCAATGDPWQGRLLLARLHLERGDVTAAEALLHGLDRPDDPEVAAAFRGLREAAPTGPIAERTTRWRSAEVQRFAVRTTPDGRLAVTGRKDGTLVLWELATGRRLHAIQAHTQWIQHCDISADGRLAATGNGEAVRVWRLADGACLHTFRPDGSDRHFWVNSLRLTGGGTLVAGTDERRIMIWDLADGSLRRRLGPGEGEFGAWTKTEVSADGQWILDTGRDGRTLDGNDAPRLWNALTGRVVRELPGYERVTVEAAWLSDDATTAALAGSDHRIRLWNLTDGTCLRSLYAASGLVEALAVTRDGRYLVSGGADTAVRLWDLSDGRCLRTFRGHGERVARLVIGADDRSVLSVGQDDTVRWWSWSDSSGYAAPVQLSRVREHVELSRHKERVQGLLREAAQALHEGRRGAAFDLVGEARAVPGHERTPDVLLAWRAVGGSNRVGLRGAWPVKVLSGQTSPHIYAAGLSDDASVAVSGSGGGPLRVWDVAGGMCVQEIDSYIVNAAAVSGDGRRVLCQGGDITVWTPDGRLRRTVKPGFTLHGKVQFSGDGRFALAPGPDRSTLQFWNLETGALLHTFTGHTGRIDATFLTRDGIFAATASPADGTLRVWSTHLGRAMRTLPYPGAYSTTSVSLNRDASLLVTSDLHLRLWDVASARLLRTFPEEPGDCTVVRFSPDGRFVFSGTRSGSLKIWNTATAELLTTLEGHQGHLWDIALTPDSRHALTAGSDATLRLWELDWTYTRPT